MLDGAQQIGLAGGHLNVRMISDERLREPAGGPQPSDDAYLATACAAGESSAFERIYREHGDRMKSIAFNHLGNVSDAEDAVQETFLKVHRSAGAFQGGSAFSTWMYRILINTCYDLLRKRKVRPVESEIETLVGRAEESISSTDSALAMSLRTVIGRLSPQRRTVFFLYEVEGLSHREIGGILGIRETYSKWLLFMAKQDLRAMWSETRQESS